MARLNTSILKLHFSLLMHPAKCLLMKHMQSYTEVLLMSLLEDALRKVCIGL